ISDSSEIKRQIEDLIREYFSVIENKLDFVLGKTRLPLTAAAYSWGEVVEALDSLLSQQVTMGEKVRQFEAMFAEYVGVRYAVMVNSGSSANLIALYVLTNPTLGNRIKPGDEVITPAVTWVTTVFPIINW